MNTIRILATIVFGIASVACTPSDKPVDIAKTQREGMEKAKNVEGQLQQQAGERMKSSDEQGK